MLWHEWNAVLDDLIEKTGRLQFCSVGGSLKSNVSDFSGLIGREKHWERLTLGKNVQSAVKRFLFSTVPNKWWWEIFARAASPDNSEPRYTIYKNVVAVRKYNGWFIALFVNQRHEIEWQTMGGYLFKWIEVLMQPFISALQAFVTDQMAKTEAERLIDVDACFKIEFCARKMSTDEEVLEDMGTIDPTNVRYVAVVVDYFKGYSDEFDTEIDNLCKTENSRARVNKMETLKANDWRKMFVQYGDPVNERLENARRIISMCETNPVFGDVEVEIAEYEVADQSLGNPAIHFLNQISTQEIEGFVLHCWTERVADAGKKSWSNNFYHIYKLKIENVGGLGFYYHRSEFNNNRITEYQGQNRGNQPVLHACAGRHFVVNLLTVECLVGTKLPLYGGIGYWDPNKNKYVVTDKVIFKSVSKVNWIGDLSSLYAGENKEYLKISGEVDTDVRFSKHRELSKYSRSAANLVAFCIEHYDPKEKHELRTMDNLELSKRYAQNAGPGVMNISRLNLKVGGSANYVYQSVNKHFHLAAPVIKCVGIDQETRVKLEINEFTNFQQMTGTINELLPRDVMAWKKREWASYQSLKEFNKSKMLIWYDEDPPSRIKPLAIDDVFISQIHPYKEPGDLPQPKLQSMRNINIWCLDCVATKWAYSRNKTKSEVKLTKDTLPLFRHLRPPTISIQLVEKCIEQGTRILNLFPAAYDDEENIVNYEMKTKTTANKQTHNECYKFFHALDGFPMDDEDILNQVDMIIIPSAVLDARGGHAFFKELKQRFKLQVSPQGHKFVIVAETFLTNDQHWFFQDAANYERINLYAHGYLDHEKDNDGEDWGQNTTIGQENVLTFLQSRQARRQEAMQNKGTGIRKQIYETYSQKLKDQQAKEFTQIKQQINDCAVQNNVPQDLARIEAVAKVNMRRDSPGGSDQPSKKHKTAPPTSSAPQPKPAPTSRPKSAPTPRLPDLPPPSPQQHVDSHRKVSNDQLFQNMLRQSDDELVHARAQAAHDQIIEQARQEQAAKSVQPESSDEDSSDDDDDEGSDNETNNPSIIQWPVGLRPLKGKGVFYEFPEKEEPLHSSVIQEYTTKLLAVPLPTRRSSTTHHYTGDRDPSAVSCNYSVLLNFVSFVDKTGGRHPAGRYIFKTYFDYIRRLSVLSTRANQKTQDGSYQFEGPEHFKDIIADIQKPENSYALTPKHYRCDTKTENGIRKLYYGKTEITPENFLTVEESSIPPISKAVFKATEMCSTGFVKTPTGFKGWWLMNQPCFSKWYIRTIHTYQRQIHHENVTHVHPYLNGLKAEVSKRHDPPLEFYVWDEKIYSILPRNFPKLKFTLIDNLQQLYDFIPTKTSPVDDLIPNMPPLIVENIPPNIPEKLFKKEDGTFDEELACGWLTFPLVHLHYFAHCKRLENHPDLSIRKIPHDYYTFRLQPAIDTITTDAQLIFKFRVSLFGGKRGYMNHRDFTNAQQVEQFLDFAFKNKYTEDEEANNFTLMQPLFIIPYSKKQLTAAHYAKLKSAAITRAIQDREKIHKTIHEVQIKGNTGIPNDADPIFKVFPSPP